MHEMINELALATEAIGLKMNVGKTKLFSTEDIDDQLPITVDGAELELVDEYVYLGQLVGITTKREAEIGRRIKAGWRAFSKHKNIFTSKKTPMMLKRLRKSDENRLVVAQRRMERVMHGISLRERKTNEWLRRTMRVNDVVETARRRKWRWAAKMARMEDDRWAKLINEWQPRTGKRKTGRPKKRWRDDIVKLAGVNWMAIARNNRRRWDRLEERYVHAEEETAICDFIAKFSLLFE